MAQDDEIAEARRKALRNGEEDPVVAAQRYLNIYRQMHIFPPERKEAFDKMLLELPSEICNIFASLPGGLMLQDYIGDLAEKKGMQRQKSALEEDKPSPILESALIQSQPQVQAQTQTQTPSTSAAVPQYIPGGNMNISLGDDFARQFAGAFDNLLARQSEMQKESLEKISANLSKNQLALAQYINQSKEAQQQSMAELVQTIMQNKSSTAPVSPSASTADSQLLQELMSSQKDISLRLSKMESTALNNNSGNQELIETLVKSNAQMLSSLNQEARSLTVAPTDNTEQLLKLIEQSQSQLIEGVVSRLLQNNVSINTAQNQANNNANNIQINAPDTTAQTLMLVEKIGDLQAAGEKNMETAISRLIAAQKDMYDSLSAAQGKEIAQAIVAGLSAANLNINSYAPPPLEAYSAAAPAPEDYAALPSEPAPQPLKTDEDMPPLAWQDDDIAADDNISPSDEVKKRKKKKKKKKDKSSAETPEIGTQAPEYAAPMSEYVTPVPDRSFDVIDAFAQTEPPAEPLDDFNNWVAETADDNTPPIDQSFTFQDEPLPANDVAAKEPSEVAAKTPATPPETEKNFWLDDEPSSVSPMVDDEPKDYFNLSELSGEDWGFGNNSASSETMDVLPDVADAPLSSDDGYEYAEVEMIGEGSNIYTTDSAAEQGGDWAPIIAHPRSISITRPPQIFDDATDDADPYVK